jgi:hypothetical protein
LVILGTVALSTGAGRHRLLVLGLGIVLGAVLAVTGGDTSAHDDRRNSARDQQAPPSGVRAVPVPAQPSGRETLRS